MASFSDDFGGADGGIGANYSLFNGATVLPDRSSGALVPHAVNDEEHWYYNGATFGAAQYAGITVSTTPATCYAGAWICLQGAPGATPSGYTFDAFKNAGTVLLRIIRVDVGAETTLISPTITLAGNDVFLFRKYASQLEVLQNGALKAAAWDAKYAGGYCGAKCYANAAGLIIDNFICGDLDVLRLGDAYGSGRAAGAARYLAGGY